MGAESDQKTQREQAVQTGEVGNPTSRELRALGEIVRVAASTQNFNEILSHVCRQAAQLCGANRAAVFLWDEAEQRVVPAMAQLASGAPVEEAWQKFKEMGSRHLREMPLIQALVDTRQPVLIPDARRSQCIDSTWVKLFDIKSILGVPLVSGDKVVGVMTLDTRDEASGFAPHQVDLAVAVGAQVAFALQKDLLLRQTEDRLRQTQAHLQIARTLSTTLEIKPLLQEIARQAAAACAMDRSAIYLWEEDGVINLTAHYTQPRVAAESWSGFQGLRGRRVADVPFLAETARRRSPIVVESSRGETSWFRRVGVPGAHVLLVAPLICQERVIGALALANTDHGNALKPGLVTLVTTVASQVALALDNARKYEQLRTAQERLIQAEKFRALAAMAGGVAHDFKNLLTAILGRTEVLRHEIDSGEAKIEDIRASLGVIELTAQDGSETIRRLLDYTLARSTEETTAVQVNELLTHVREVARPRWKSEALSRGVKIKSDLEPGNVPPVLGNASELREVLLNLVFNAIDAMPEGGRFTLASGTQDGQVWIEVRDTGVGMTREVEHRIFDPFFTTKGEGSSGLGLSASYGIIRRHGGSLTVQSQPGEGSTFTITLPATEPPGSEVVGEREGRSPVDC